jgi:hypothetical protein
MPHLDPDQIAALVLIWACLIWLAFGIARAAWKD